MSHVLAVLEQRDGALRKVSHEVVTGARRLADALGGEVHALVLGAGPVSGTDAAGRFGADKVITATNAGFAQYAPEGYARAVAERAKAGGYGAVVFAASAHGQGPRPARRGAARRAARGRRHRPRGRRRHRSSSTRPVYAGKALLKVKVTADAGGGLAAAQRVHAGRAAQGRGRPRRSAVAGRRRARRR